MVFFACASVEKLGQEALVSVRGEKDPKMLVRLVAVVDAVVVFVRARNDRASRKNGHLRF